MITATFALFIGYLAGCFIMAPETSLQVRIEHVAVDQRPFVLYAISDHISSQDIAFSLRPKSQVLWHLGLDKWKPVLVIATQSDKVIHFSIRGHETSLPKYTDLIRATASRLKAVAE